ncbi:hypothetical protein GCM10023149_09960 [Mucilaginibacter gynuensis]|uniref:Glycosyltransferase 2-like domain-containing protein n=1 Tax=Mucilaginibacter gynuensis TaxID=1302236 RepID=A0ABP8FZ76_9SPHI
MKLSVIVVNHNMCAWLRQSISSLIKACNSFDCELIVVDNGSTDRSVNMLKTEFAEVKLIENDKNIGVTKAYNQAIKVSHGEYILMINPDTITGSDTLEKIINFMDAHQHAGGVSVRMVNPQGHFLASSKYGFNRGWAKLFKFTGLAKYFPKSHIANRKYANWAEEFETTEVDVLNGACFLLRREALNVTGLLDERFFKYGYDIDISFRLKMEGFKNYYFPKTYIINFNVHKAHKFSWNYVRHFYGAMFIFVAKYLFEVPKINLGGMPQMYQAQYEVER